MKERLKTSLRVAAIHFLASLALAGIIALLVFTFWFPSHLRQLTGGLKLFFLVVAVDVVCGPLLTLVVFNPKKRTSELKRDLAIVGIFQLLALSFGVHSLSYAKPIALVFEVDRFRVVSYADLDEADAVNAPTWAHVWSFSSPTTVSVRRASSAKEMMASIDASLQGVESSQRPSWWQDYSLAVPQVLERSRSLVDLHSKHPERSVFLQAAAVNAAANKLGNETSNPNELRWLPLVSRRAADWVVLVDPVTARVRGSAHLNGY